MNPKLVLVYATSCIQPCLRCMRTSIMHATSPEQHAVQGSCATCPLFSCPFSVQTRGDWGTFLGVWAALGDKACVQGAPAVMAWQSVHHKESKNPLRKNCFPVFTAPNAHLSRAHGPCLHATGRHHVLPVTPGLACHQCRPTPVHKPLNHGCFQYPACHWHRH